MLCALTALLGALALAAMGQPRNGALLLALTAVLAGALLLAPAALRPRTTLLALVAALGASLIVTTAVNGPQPPVSYWPPFFIWLAAVAGLGLYALRDHLIRPWHSAAARRELALVACLTLAGLGARIVRLDSLPSPFSGDEAAHLLQALRVSEGTLTNMFASGLQGQPTAYYFALSGTTSVFGESVFGARMFGVLLGTGLIPAVYLLLRQLFDARVAALGSAYLVGYHLALHFSRQDLNNIGDPLVLALVCLLAWRSVTDRHTADYVLTGLVAGIGIYVNVGCRVALPLAGAVWLAALLLGPTAWRQHLKGVAVAAAAFAVAAGPLALFWYEHPNEFMDRIRAVGIYQSGWLEREREITGRGELSLLAEQAVRAFGAFGYYTDRIPHYAGPLPLIDRLSLPFFLIGAALALRRIREPRYHVLVLLFVTVVVSGGVLTEQPPTAQRLLGTIPASAGFLGIGLAAAGQFAARYLAGGRGAAAIAAVVLAVLLAYNLRYYFITYARGDYFSDFNTRTAQRAGEYARSLAPGTPLFWYGSPHLGLGHPALSFALRDLLVYDVPHEGRFQRPADAAPGEAVFLVMPHRGQELDRILRLCPGGAGWRACSTSAAAGRCSLLTVRRPRWTAPAT